jgi:hypothetical protein
MLCYGWPALCQLCRCQPETGAKNRAIENNCRVHTIAAHTHLIDQRECLWVLADCIQDGILNRKVIDILQHHKAGRCRWQSFPAVARLYASTATGTISRPVLPALPLPPTVYQGPIVSRQRHSCDRPKGKHVSVEPIHTNVCMDGFCGNTHDATWTQIVIQYIKDIWHRHPTP